MGLGGVWKRVRGSLRERPHNLLAVSDLHFGCDLKPGARPMRRGFDGQFAAFLDFHAANRKDRKPWRLILNGDIVDFVAITVTDTGEGISPEILPRVFQRFVKGPGSTGSGLGLAITHDIITAHGGTIEIQSTVGSGTTVRITLPPATT